jgi:hypothetical protein
MFVRAVEIKEEDTGHVDNGKLERGRSENSHLVGIINEPKQSGHDMCRSRIKAAITGQLLAKPVFESEGEIWSMAPRLAIVWPKTQSTSSTVQAWMGK